MDTDAPGGRAAAAGPAPWDRSVGELFSAVRQDVTTLIRQEVAQAKAEIRESATRADLGAGMLGGSGVTAHLVLLLVSISAWWGIGQFTGNAWSALIWAAASAATAAALYLLGRSRLTHVEGLNRTADTAKKIPRALAGKEDT